MKRTLLTASVVVLAVVGSYASRAVAADAKIVRGTVTAVATDSVAIAAGSQPMTFRVDSGTHVEAAGAGTKSRAAQAEGKSGAKLTDLIRTGQSVEIAYAPGNGGMHATSIRRIPDLPAVDTASASEAHGKVTAVSATSLTIAGSSRGATFTQTYAIDPSTRVIGKGVGTAMAAKGGRSSITDVVGVGASVSVSYHAGADTPHAAEVRVIQSSASSSK